MSELKDRLRSDLTTAIKARDELRSSTLRMVLTAITNAEVAGKEARELSDDDIVGVLSTEAKKRREAATAFSDAGRTELADKETAEAAVIADYLPEQLDADAIAELVTAAIAADRRRRRGHAGDGQGDGRGPAAGAGSRRRRRRRRGGQAAAGLARRSSSSGSRRLASGRPSTVAVAVPWPCRPLSPPPPWWCFVGGTYGVPSER